MKNNIDLYWFSGTGNSLFIAINTKKRLESLGYNCRILPIEKQNPKEIELKKTIGLIVPVAMQGTYPIVWEFIDNLPKADGEEFFLIDTLGTYSGGIKGPIKKIVKLKGYTPVGAIEIKMPNLFLRKSPDSKDARIVEKALETLDKYCHELHEGKTHWTDIPIYSDLMSKFFRTQENGTKWVKKFPKTVTEQCTNCGICVQLCPRNCIDENSRHINVDSDNCLLCQRCLEYCPSNAIQINGRNFIKNHLIKIRELKNYIK